MNGHDATIETAAAGTPHRGRVLAAVFPHADDFALFAGGLIAKLVREGYAAFLIRASNDEMDSYDMDPDRTAAANRADTEAMARVLGARKVYHLGYRNHYLDGVPQSEFRHRLIALFRFLRVDTAVTFDPYGSYEENPDHTATARAVEAACWMAGGPLDLPEHRDMGLAPRAVEERYYAARGPQLVNRVVDVSGVIDGKRGAIGACRTQVRHMALRHRDGMVRRGETLPDALRGDEDALIAWFTEERLLEATRRTGRDYGMAFAETYHHTGPGDA